MSDRIELRLTAAPEHAAALETHGELIKSETLATALSVTAAADPQPAAAATGAFSTLSAALGGERHPSQSPSCTPNATPNPESNGASL